MKDRLDQEERDKSIVPNHCFGKRKEGREGERGGERRERGAVKVEKMHKSLR